MSTTHQQQVNVRLWHETRWTLVDDAPGRMTSVERFDTADAACTAMNLRGAGYVIPPSNPAPAHERSLAAEGYTSYRYKGRFGWIMIGARDTVDALREARRSTDDPVTVAELEIWNGNEYTEVTA